MKKGYKQIVNELPTAGFLDEIKPDDMSVLKKVVLNATVDINNFCEAHKLTMYLVGGSCLGAIRHKGFIPWDDDLDIAMTRKDYELFKALFEKELGEKYILNSPNYSQNPITRFPKVLIKGTTLQTLESNDEMAYVDIFIIENVPSNALLRKFKGFFSMVVTLVSSCVYTYHHDNETIRSFMMQDENAYRLYKRRMAIGKFISFLSLKKWMDLTDKSFQYKNETDYCGLPSGRKHYFGEILKRDVFFPAKQVEFEGKKFNVFCNYDAYLSNLYGNYMEIPPIEKREKHMIVGIKFTDELKRL